MMNGSGSPPALVRQRCSYRFFREQTLVKDLVRNPWGVQNEAPDRCVKTELLSWAERLNAPSHSGLRTIGTPPLERELARPVRVAPKTKFSAGLHPPTLLSILVRVCAVQIVFQIGVAIRCDPFMQVRVRRAQPISRLPLVRDAIVKRFHARSSRRDRRCGVLAVE